MVYIDKVGGVLGNALVGLDVGDNLIIVVQRFGADIMAAYLHGSHPYIHHQEQDAAYEHRTPDTLEYSCETLVPDTLYSITMHIGFRIEPRVSLYLRQVVEDLVASKKVDLRSTYPSLRKNRIPGDFRFIIIHRVYYPESSGNRQQNLLMTLYALISKIGIDDSKALGLDTSMVVVERVPLIIDQSNRSVRRIIQIAEEK